VRASSTPPRSLFSAKQKVSGKNLPKYGNKDERTLLKSLRLPGAKKCAEKSLNAHKRSREEIRFGRMPGKKKDGNRKEDRPGLRRPRPLTDQRRETTRGEGDSPRGVLTGWYHNSAIFNHYQVLRGPFESRKSCLEKVRATQSRP